MKFEKKKFEKKNIDIDFKNGEMFSKYESESEQHIDY